MTDDRKTVLCPGRRYDGSAPLLFFARQAAQRRESDTHILGWSTEAMDDTRLLVEQVADVLDCLETTRKPLLIGKSLGSFAAVLAAERDLPAVWLTPLLNQEEVVAALERATAPCLLIGGTADEWSWDGGLARRLSPHVHEVDGGDHSLMLPDRPLAESAAVLGTVTTAIERFMDDLVWPRTG